MSLFRARQRREFYGITGAQDLIPSRSAVSRYGSATVTSDTAMRLSAVWACLRLRADLISTLPVSVYRELQGQRIDLPKPPILVAPGGERWDYLDWMWATQHDVDRCGNTVGLIAEWNGYGLPALIELQNRSNWAIHPAPKKTLSNDPGAYQFRIGGKDYDPPDVWHERQYPIAGTPLGMSPIHYAAMVEGEQLSIMNYSLDWFGGGARPAAHLKNAQRTVPPPAAEAIKGKFKATLAAGDVFVTGSDWEYNPIQAENAGLEWLEARKFGVTEISRFFGCPADLIDGAVSGEAVTYANISQRNLQFLIMHLGPAVARREHALSKLIPALQRVQLDTDALLRMDPATRAKWLQTLLLSRQLAPSEARAIENRAPYTPEQIAEFDLLQVPLATAKTTEPSTIQ